MKTNFTFLAILTSLYANAQVGIGTTTPLARLHVIDSSVLFSAQDDIPGTPGQPPVSGAGRRMMWYPDKAAFRAGYVGSAGSTYWDMNNIGNYSFATGKNCRATGSHSFAAGLSTTASGSESVALGNNGFANGDRSFAFNGSAIGIGTIAMGNGAQASGDDAVAIGASAGSAGVSSIVLGPSLADGNFSIAIGLLNRATGQFAVAIGKNARAMHQGSCVMGDGSAVYTSDHVYSTANNQMTMRYVGGYQLYTSMNLASGVMIAAGGGSWSSVSDFRKKENFMEINKEDILRKLAALPITNWNYKTQAADHRHIGPTAQDFYAAFQLDGPGNDTTINTVDIDGVNMAAIQALEKRTAQLQQENEQLKATLNAMNQRMVDMEKMIAKKPRKKKR